MKKKYVNSKLIVFLSVVVMIGVLIFSSVSAIAAEKIIRLAHDMGPDPNTPTHAYALIVKQVMEAETDYTVEIYPASELGGERDRLDQTADGSIQINLASIGGMGMIYKPILLYGSPFMYRSDRVFREFCWRSDWNGYIFEKFKEETTNLEPIHAYQRGCLNAFTNNKFPITSLDDFKKLKLRAMDVFQAKLFQALGASATIIPFAELYTALQTGVVDGQINPVAMIRDMGFQEVQDYLTLARCMPGSGFVVVCQNWYQNLPDDIRNTLNEAFFTASLTSAGLSQKRYGETLNYYKENKSFKEINSLAENPESYAEIRKIGQEAAIEWAKSIMDDEIVDRYVEGVREIEKSIYKD